MPLSKQKLRKIVGVLEPSLKGELLAEQLRDDVTDKLSELVQNFNSKIKQLKESILSELTNRLREIPDLSEDLTSIGLELETRLSELEKEEIPNIQTQMQDIVSDKIDDKELTRKLEDKIEKIRDEFHYRLSNRGSGNANRQINVNSSVMSTYYTDINFQQFGNVGWTATNDHDLKRVNIRASILTGDTGITQLTGDVTAGPGSGSQVATISSLLAAGGPTGSSTVIPTITWNNQGRLTAVSSVAAGVVPSGQTYSISNVTTDRTYDANSTTVDELADTLGTLIADLRAAGIIL